LHNGELVFLEVVDVAEYAFDLALQLAVNGDPGSFRSAPK
jgi:hypothetical protein